MIDAISWDNNHLLDKQRFSRCVNVGIYPEERNENGKIQETAVIEGCMPKGPGPPSRYQFFFVETKISWDSCSLLPIQV